jgi:hypothetical protein
MKPINVISNFLFFFFLFLIFLNVLKDVLFCIKGESGAGLAAI